jgi:Zn-dependent protease
MTDPNLPYTIAVWLIPLVIAIVFHEVAHGYVARIFGDHTAERLGRLTLNPLRHVDPIGTVLLPMVLAIAHVPIFGWAKPVPVDARRMRNPRRDMMLVALAGPATNFVLATLTAFVLAGLLLVLHGVPAPLPPFDGGHVVQGLLPRAAAIHYAKLARYGFPLLLVLLFVLPMISPQTDIVHRFVAPIAGAATDFFFGIANLGAA